MTKSPLLIADVGSTIRISVSQTSLVHAPEAVVRRASPCPGSWSTWGGKR